MLKAANHVLYQTVRGFLEHGYHVSLVLNADTGHEHENIATTEDLFPNFLHKIEVNYYKAFGSGFFRSMSKLRRLS